jgi:hypothetical protein
MVSSRKFERKNPRYGMGFKALKQNLKNFVTCLFSLSFEEKKMDSFALKLLTCLLKKFI